MSGPSGHKHILDEDPVEEPAQLSAEFKQELNDEVMFDFAETVEQEAPAETEPRGSVPDAPEPLDSPEARRPPKVDKAKERRNLMKEAHSIAHLVSHHTFNPFCQACVEARSQRKGHRKGALIDNIEPTGEWGRHVTGDHYVESSLLGLWALSTVIVFCQIFAKISIW